MNAFCSPLCRLHLSPLIINEHLKNNSWMIYEDSQWLRVIRNFWQSSSGISNIDRHWLAILEEVLQQTTVREIIYHPLFWKCIIERFQGLFVFNIWSLCDMTVHKETASLTAEFKTQNSVFWIWITYYLYSYHVILSVVKIKCIQVFCEWSIKSVQQVTSCYY